MCPVRPITEQTQVRERFLRAAGLALELGQLVAELDQQLAVRLALVGRQHQDARHVVILATLLLLGEVANDVAAFGVAFAHDVEEERVRVVVERFVVEEELGEQAEVLGVGLVLPTVDLEERDGVLAIDLVTRGVFEVTLGDVSLEADPGLDELEAELADEDAGQGDELDGIGGEVPRSDPVTPQLDQFDVLHPCDGVIVCTGGGKGAGLSGRGRGGAGLPALAALLERLRAR